MTTEDSKRNEASGPDREPVSEQEPEPAPERAPDDGAPDPLSERKDLIEKVDEIRDLLVFRRAAEAVDLLDLLKSKRRLMVNNFLLGLFRGIGFFLGATIIGSLLVAIVLLSLEWVDTVFGRDEGTTASYLQEMIEDGTQFKSSAEGGESQEEKELREMIGRILEEERQKSGQEASPPGENGNQPEEEDPDGKRTNAKPDGADAPTGKRTSQ